MPKRWLITGGAGFIGSCLVRRLAARPDVELVVLDKLTYAGNLASISRQLEGNRVRFVQGDIVDPDSIKSILIERSINAVLHLATESHVDRSIESPEAFLMTNVVGTFRLLESSLQYWRGLPESLQSRFRFLHVSTDEVFGTLDDEPPFTERSSYAPNSPYAASKAASDHFVRAYYRTYGLPILITHCSNNFGPYQYPEKLIPVLILAALHGQPMPIYGDGLQRRDWLFVEDHCEALEMVLENGRPGETYNIGSGVERTNLQVAHAICDDLVNRYAQLVSPGLRSSIQHVEDRPGHDRRYAINPNKLKSELGWDCKSNFDEGLRTTIDWYVDHLEWARTVLDGNHFKRGWMELRN